MHTLFQFPRIKRFKFWKIKIILLRITALRLRSCIVYRSKIAKWLCSLKLIKNLGKIIVNLKAKCLRNNWGSDKKHRSYEKKSVFNEFQGYIFFKNARMGGGGNNICTLSQIWGRILVLWLFFTKFHIFFKILTSKWPKNAIKYVN